jgi:hypothetical protein
VLARNDVEGREAAASERLEGADGIEVRLEEQVGEATLSAVISMLAIRSAIRAPTGVVS